MSSKIKNFGSFIGHIRAENTISDISMQLERFQDFHSSDYEDELLDNYINEAKELLDKFSDILLKMAEEEVIKKETVMPAECIVRTSKGNEWCSQECSDRHICFQSGEKSEP